MGGDYILGVSSKMLAKIDNPDVIQILSQVRKIILTQSR
jgi:hypothetical protein